MTDLLSRASARLSRSDTRGWANIHQHKWANIHCHSQYLRKTVTAQVA